MVPKILSVLLKYCIMSNGTENLFCTVENPPVNGTERIFGTVTRYISTVQKGFLVPLNG